jgi:hypothetical protein
MARSIQLHHIWMEKWKILIYMTWKKVQQQQIPMHFSMCFVEHFEYENIL